MSKFGMSMVALGAAAEYEDLGIRLEEFWDRQALAKVGHSFKINTDRIVSAIY